MKEPLSEELTGNEPDITADSCALVIISTQFSWSFLISDLLLYLLRFDINFSFVASALLEICKLLKYVVSVKRRYIHTYNKSIAFIGNLF